MSPLSVAALALPAVLLLAVGGNSSFGLGNSSSGLGNSSSGPGNISSGPGNSSSGPGRLVKCCGARHVLFKDKKASPQGSARCEALDSLATTVQYSGFQIYRKHIETKKELAVKTIDDFEFMYDDKFSPNNTNVFFGSPKSNLLYIIEDGSLRLEHPHYYDRWKAVDTIHFCVEMLIIKKKTGDYTSVQRIGLIEDPPALGEYGSDFALAGYVVSSAFMALALAAHAALPQLRNIAGLMRAGYVATLLPMYATKAVQLAGARRRPWSAAGCRLLSSITFYLFLSSFFWLNVMSFDIWWTFRGTRKRRAIHRRGETVKFLWYCLYAWGAPLALTALAATIDAMPLAGSPHVIKMHFDKCFQNVKEVLLYAYVPVMIMTAVNCLLFLMTIYNIWLVKHAARHFDSRESRSTQRNRNNFNVYLNLSLLMGVSWVLDIIQFLCDIAPWTYFVFNFYNFFIGIPIFFIFVFNKKTITMLCQRFNISDRYVARMTSTSRGQTTTASDSIKSTKTTNTNDTQLDPDAGDRLMTESNL